MLPLASFDSDLALTQNNTLIKRVLLGIEEPRMRDLARANREKYYRLKNEQCEIPLGIFTNDSYKEISAIIFSTTNTFEKAIVQSGVERYIRSTRYRALDVNHFIVSEGMKNEGTHMKKLSTEYYLKNSPPIFY